MEYITVEEFVEFTFKSHRQRCIGKENHLAFQRDLTNSNGIYWKNRELAERERENCLLCVVA